MTAKRVAIVAADEPRIRFVAVGGLVEASFEAIDAEDAAALFVLSSHIASVHPRFTDVEMAGTMRRFELAHHTHAHWLCLSLLGG